MAKEFLSSHHIEFEEKDITREREALVELVETHQSRSTPTFLVDEQVVIGFNRQELERLLGFAQHPNN